MYTSGSAVKCTDSRPVTTCTDSVATARSLGGFLPIHWEYSWAGSIDPGLWLKGANTESQGAALGSVVRSQDASLAPWTGRTVPGPEAKLLGHLKVHSKDLLLSEVQWVWLLSVSLVECTGGSINVKWNHRVHRKTGLFLGLFPGHSQ